ncbi:unnamed protein product [Spirodela intermedia]|uniref:Uncharacterized protein n=1 Tax=Spirodela intermedia TaxID=51605 RepID=A0A7I8J561_SPIIN|nr:unnamed protein product [Spirodela intermedia]CAA6665367.1 unnamed protein product [Spirodela intermedia]
MNEVLTAADMASSSSSSAAPRGGTSLPTNLPLLSAFLAFAVAQFLKYKEKRWDSKRLIASGGMPSSHSATVAALAVAIGLRDGVGASSFALAVVLSVIVMYDASGIRLHAGRQAEVLPFSGIMRVPSRAPLSNVRPLREPLGHTPFQVVAGAVLGCVISLLLRSSA